MAKAKTMTVLKNPNQELRKISSPVQLKDVATPTMQELVNTLKATMKKENGVGIAAPQVGIHERVIIAETEAGPTAFINPEIIETSFKMVDSEEGCLSVPGVWGVVQRHRSVKVKALNEQAEEVVLKANGLLAIIFQHEIDHLNGILFIDRAEKVQPTNGKQVSV